MKTFDFWCDAEGCVHHGRVTAVDIEEARWAPETVHICDNPNIQVRLSPEEEEEAQYQRFAHFLRTGGPPD